MAAATYTYTINMAGSPKALHAGDNTLAWNFNGGASKVGTLSDVILLGKIPNGALIFNEEVRFGAVLMDAAHWGLVLLATEALGTYSIYATLIASMTASSTAATTYRSVIPTKVSLSDDRAVQYVTLAMNCSTGASGTVSFSTQGFVSYLTDGSNV
jgi:hypothetical protein